MSGFFQSLVTRIAAIWSTLAASGGSALVGFIQSGIGAVLRTTQDKLRDSVSVKDFGAKGDGTDDSPAFQKAVNRAILTGSNRIFVPFDNGEKYKLSSKINIACAGFLIEGNAPSVYDPDINGNGYIYTDTNALSGLFDYGVGGNYNTSQLTVKNIAFYNAAGKANAAILYTQDNNGPHRGVRFIECSAKGFPSVVKFECPTAAIAAEGVVVEGCCFNGNEAVINAITSITDLRVVGNQIEQNSITGEKITGKINGAITITNNNFEGQSNPINCDSYTPNLVIENNYFENNPGDYLVRLKGTNANACLTVRKNWQSNNDSHKDTIRLEGVCSVNEEQEFYGGSTLRTAMITLLNTIVGYGSKLRGPVYVGTDAGDSAAGFCDPLALCVGPTSDAAIERNLGVVALNTPFGKTTTGASVAGYPGAVTNLSMNYATGDIVLGCALVRINNSGETPFMELRTNGAVPIGIQSPLGFPSAQSDKGWRVIFAIGIAQATASYLQFRFGADGVAGAPTTTIDIAAVGGMKVVPGNWQNLHGITRAPITLFAPF